MKFAAGVNVTDPFAFRTAVPFVAFAAAVTVRLSPLVSVSFPVSTACVNVTGVSSFVEAVSSPATGAALAAVVASATFE